MLEPVGVPLPWGIIPLERLWVPFDPPNPAPGARWRITVPGGRLWVVQGFRATLTTGAAVGNRRARVIVEDPDGSERGTIAASSIDVPAGSVTDVGGMLLASPAPGQFVSIGSVGLPVVYLQPQWVFAVQAYNMDVGDQWSNIHGWVAEYQLRGLERAAERYARAVADAVPG